MLELYGDLERAILWLGTKGVTVRPTSRFDYAQIVHQNMISNHPNGIRVLAPNSSDIQGQYCAVLPDILDLVRIHKDIELAGRGDVPVSTLERLVRGPAFPDQEKPDNGSQNARNAQFELASAARFCASGYSVSFAVEDFVAENSEFRVVVECKRLYSHKRFEGRLVDARDQLLGKRDESAKNEVMMAFIKIIHPANYGIQVNTLGQAEASTRVILDSFIRDHGHAIKARANGHVDCVVLVAEMVDVHSVDLNGQQWVFGMYSNHAVLRTSERHTMDAIRRLVDPIRTDHSTPSAL